MWYFTWILGVLLACAFGIINVLWLEAQEGLDQNSAILDPLTRLPTRVTFMEMLEEKIEPSSEQQSLFSLLMIGLEFINNQNEHNGIKSDSFVLSVADTIKRETRAPLDFVARYDAGTFVVILPGADSKTAEAISSRICSETVNQVHQTDCSKISIGIAEFPLHSSCKSDEATDEKIRNILQITHKALQKARRDGGNQYCDATQVTIKQA